MSLRGPAWLSSFSFHTQRQGCSCHDAGSSYLVALSAAHTPKNYASTALSEPETGECAGYHAFEWYKRAFAGPQTLQEVKTVLLCIHSTANPLSRLLAALLQAEGGEDEPKQYKKANLGLSNQMYYNEEVGRAKAATCTAAVWLRAVGLTVSSSQQYAVRSPTPASSSTVATTACSSRCGLSAARRMRLGQRRPS